MEEKCFVCAQPASVQSDDQIATDEYRLQVDCTYCGRFTIPFSIVEDLPADPEASELKPFLSAYVRQSQRLSSGSHGVAIRQDWKEHARAHASTPISQRMRRLREVIAERSRIGGEIR